MIGLGIVTSGTRPAFFQQALDSVSSLEDVEIAVQTDLDRVQGHRGVGWAKNKLLSHFLDRGYEWTVLMEDDIVVTDPNVLNVYTETAKAARYPHLMFAHHGGRNRTSIAARHPAIECWPNCVGAFCLYSREALERCGLMDEGFPPNVLEHVEHSQRILRAYGHKGHPFWPDVAYSNLLLRECDGSRENRAVKDDPVVWEKGKAYWRETHPETYKEVFG